MPKKVKAPVAHIKSPVEDIVVTSFNSGHAAQDPHTLILQFKTQNAVEHHFAMTIQDARILGERLIADAKRLAAVAAEFEKGKAQHLRAVK